MVNVFLKIEKWKKDFLKLILAIVWVERVQIPYESLSVLEKIFIDEQTAKKENDLVHAKSVLTHYASGIFLPALKNKEIREAVLRGFYADQFFNEANKN